MLIPALRSIYRKKKADYEDLANSFVAVGVRPEDVEAVVRLFDWDDAGIPSTEAEVRAKAIAKLAPYELRALGLDDLGGKAKKNG